MPSECDRYGVWMMIGGIRKALLRVDFRCSAEELRAFWAR